MASLRKGVGEWETEEKGQEGDRQEVTEVVCCTAAAGMKPVD